MSKRRVVVTGLGLVTPLGNTVEESWEKILAGVSGIAPITHFDTTGYPVHFGGSVRDLDLDAYISKKEQRKMDPFIHYGMVAGIQAFEDAGIEVTGENSGRIGVAVGSGIGGLPGIEKGTHTIIEGGPRKLSPFYVPSNIINMIAGHLSIRFGLRGPNFAIVTACTTGTHNIGSAARLIQNNEADVMIAGGAEMATCPTGIAGFANAKALSTRNDAPEQASRPWDRERDGFVLSDGAGIIVLEEYEHARRRDARIYAEVIGYGMSGDAYHMTLPDPDGAGAALSMKNAIHDAGIEPGAVDYINAHGTSTQAGDRVESDAIKDVFGEHAYKLAVSSTKSMTGHLLGAAGGIEAVFSILAMRDQAAPPTINLDNPDPECDLDYVPHEARQMPLQTALSNSFGFGGTNGSLIFRGV